MSKYYYLISGLPSIALGGGKLAYSVCEFQTEIEDMLSSRDKKLIDLFYLKYGSISPLAHAKRPGSDPDRKGKITYDKFSTLYRALKDEEKIPKNDNLPPYFVQFFKLYLAEEAKDTRSEEEYISWEDRLAALYYECAMECGSKFVVDWFELSLNTNNVLTAITYRKYGFDRANYVVRHNEIAENIRTSNARDLGLGDSVEYLPELQYITEEANLIIREKRVDLLKWKWLDDNASFRTSDIESVPVCLLELEMIERWVTLDKTRGERTFRELVGITKMGSENALREFKRSNIK